MRETREWTRGDIDRRKINQETNKTEKITDQIKLSRLCNENWVRFILYICALNDRNRSIWKFGIGYYVVSCLQRKQHSIGSFWVFISTISGFSVFRRKIEKKKKYSPHRNFVDFYHNLLAACRARYTGSDQRTRYEQRQQICGRPTKGIWVVVFRFSWNGSHVILSWLFQRAVLMYSGSQSHIQCERGRVCVCVCNVSATVST